MKNPTERYVMKKIILITILVCIFLTSCSANNNIEEQILQTYTTETYGVETVFESTESATNESKITNSAAVSETTETLQTTETPKTLPNYDVEGIPYKAASIVYGEYLKFQNGQFEDWWVDDEDNESPHACTKVLIFDMNGDGRQELLSMKWAISPYSYRYYTIYDLDSGEMLFNNYCFTGGKLYYKDDQYCLKLEHPMAFVTVTDEEFDSAIFNVSELGYNEADFYIGNKVNFVIYQYISMPPVRSPYEGTKDSYCRRFSSTEGFAYYHGDYDSQIEQQQHDFESIFVGYNEIGELWYIGETVLVNDVEVDYSVDGIWGIKLPQWVVNDFDALVERLSLYDE